MRVTITSKFIENTIKDEREACYAFSYEGGKELFSPWYDWRSDRRLRIFIARIENRIIGWSSCDMTRTQDRVKKNKDVLYWAEDGFEAAVMVNVLTAYRRRGIGKRLVSKAIAYAHSKKKAVRVFPHDDTSRKFYDGMDVINGRKVRLIKGKSR